MGTDCTEQDGLKAERDLLKLELEKQNALCEALKGQIAMTGTRPASVYEEPDQLKAGVYTDCKHGCMSGGTGAERKVGASSRKKGVGRASAVLRELVPQDGVGCLQGTLRKHSIAAGKSS